MARQNMIEKYSYLIGQKINKWTVFDIIKKDCGDGMRPYANCKCECGTVKLVLVKNLINNRSKDCGCGRKRTVGELFSKDLTGQKFGKLLVIESLKDRSEAGHKLYRCLCDCGNEIVLQTNQLTTHHTSSCGCLLSYYNMYIKKLLCKKKIEYKSEFCVYIDGNMYRFDFYLPRYNLFIEYDGEQHYKPVRFHTQSNEEMERTFEETQRRDKIKNRYCEDNDINLLRIPYWEKENIETIINSHLQRLSEKGFVESVQQSMQQSELAL